MKEDFSRETTDLLNTSYSTHHSQNFSSNLTRMFKLLTVIQRHYFYMTIYLFIYLSTYLFIYLPIHLFIYLSTYLFIYLPIYLSTHLSFYPSIYSSIHPSIHLSIHLFFYPSIYSSSVSSPLSPFSSFLAGRESPKCPLS